VLRVRVVLTRDGCFLTLLKKKTKQERLFAIKDLTEMLAFIKKRKAQN